MEYVIGFISMMSFMLFAIAFMVKKEERYTQLEGAIDGVRTDPITQNKWLSKIENLLTKVFPTQVGMEAMEKNLRHAGHPFGWDAQDVKVVQTILSIALVAVSLVLDTTLAGHVFIGILFLLMGFVTPILLISSYKSVRQSKIRKQIRPFLFTLALLTNTGIRFEQALYETITATTGIFKPLLLDMQKRLDFRSTVAEGFGWLAEEVGIQELENLHLAIEQATINGTSLSFALQGIIVEYDNEMKNRIERLTQNITLKVILIVVFLILAPSVGFDTLLGGLNFINSLNGL